MKNMIVKGTKLEKVPFLTGRKELFPLMLTVIFTSALLNEVQAAINNK